MAAPVDSPWLTCPGTQSLDMGYGSGSVSSSLSQSRSPPNQMVFSSNALLDAVLARRLKLSYFVYSTYRKLYPCSADDGDAAWSLMKSELERSVGDRGTRENNLSLTQKERTIPGSNTVPGWGMEWTGQAPNLPPNSKHSFNAQYTDREHSDASTDKHRYCIWFLPIGREGITVLLKAHTSPFTLEAETVMSRAPHICPVFWIFPWYCSDLI